MSTRDTRSEAAANALLADTAALQSALYRARMERAAAAASAHGEQQRRAYAQRRAALGRLRDTPAGVGLLASALALAVHFLPL